MGALHGGHLSLIRRARRENDVVVVSVFVNPSQFGQGEDFRRYPRPFARDKKLCEKEKVDVIFNPPPQTMYPKGYLTYISVDRMSDVLCGKHRPGHFKGVATVVAKLFNIVQPDRAYFGLKDFQQARIIGRMTADLNVPVDVVTCPTVREKDGLAMSSRNVYLGKSQRKNSVLISEALHSAVDMVKCRKAKNADKIIEKVKKDIRRIAGARVDYVDICDPETLEKKTVAKPPFVILAAVRIGKTRLIDNVILLK